ncbi:MAG: MotA/TolQ/ExbB proton channel family protein [Rikenellaceae bacterium]
MIEFILQNLTTSITCLVIIIAAIYYFSTLFDIQRKFNTRWSRNKFDKNIPNIESDKYISVIYNEYKSTIIFPNVSNEMKSDLRADEFLNITTVLRAIDVNHRAMSSAAGVLVGLGLLGTFLGLTLGVQQFDSSTTESIQNSISALLGGMGTAFITSLVGMFLSTTYIVTEKLILNKLSRQIDKICDYLDKKYFISQPEKYALIYERQNKQFAELFTTKDESGNIVTPANLLRDIYEENRKQTKALSGFTEELFIEVVNSAMSESLIPLVAEVKNVTDTLSLKLEEFAQKVQNPGEDLADGIVKELKESITTLLTELKQTVSSIAGDKIDDLNNEMQTATAALATFPERMESMMDNLSDHFSNINHLVDKLVKDASSLNEGNVNQMQTQIESVTTMMTNTTSQIEKLIEDMSTKSLDANSSIVQQMQEQVNYSTTNMNNLTNTIQEVMTKLNKQTEEANTNVVKSQALMQERSNSVIDNFTANLSTVMQEAVAKLNKQTEEISMNMMSSQEQNQSISDKTLASFASTISGFEELIMSMKNTISQFTNLQTETNKTASHLGELSRNTLSSTVTLREAQSDFISEVKDNSVRSLESIQLIESALKEAKDLPQEYVQQFGLIKNALATIFEGINNGLKQYNLTMKGSTEEVMERYSSSMTDAINKLSNAIDELGTVVEDISNIKRKY